MDQLTGKAFFLREKVLDLVYRAKSGHIGGDFSVMETLVTLFHKHMNVSPALASDPQRDRFLLSKGHSVEALYCVLADMGFFPWEDLDSYGSFGTKYIGHPNNKINGIEMNSGSLGHGLPVAVGMALAGKMDHSPRRVYVVMGDGELAEGSVWEGAMAAGHYHLDQLTAVVDRNRLQISGGTEQVMSQDPQDDRWRAFGWEVFHAEGNSIKDLDRAFTLAKQTVKKPTVIIADTVKGYGVSFMEGDASWHHRIPTGEEYEAAKRELADRRRNTDE